MENPVIKEQDRFNNRRVIRNPRPISTTACECEEYEAVSVWKGQRLCAGCLEGILGVRLL